MIRCAEIEAALGELHSCSEVDGSARVSTHCLYPSFEPVVISISRYGSGFHVHDDGGAYREAWLHGRDEHAISRALSRSSSRYQTKTRNNIIYADTDSVDWLPSLILAVANASASAATAAVDKSPVVSDVDLKTKIFTSLENNFPTFNVKRGFLIKGKSGKEYDFDFGVFGPTSTILLVNAVIPHPNSIASKFLAFSDSSSTYGSETKAGFRYQRFAVYDRPLADDDSALIRQVADLVPIRSLEAGARRALLH